MKGKRIIYRTGNMGGALIHAACRALDPAQVHITDYMVEKAQEMAGRFGLRLRFI